MLCGIFKNTSFYTELLSYQFYVNFTEIFYSYLQEWWLFYKKKLLNFKKD